MQNKSKLQTIWDFLGIPFRLVFFDQAWLPRFKWTTLEEERIYAVLPNIKGKLLDIGAGNNQLVQRYKNGVGVDVFDWGGGVKVVQDTSNLPFEDRSFDTIAFIACLNHIPYRADTLREANRLIQEDGILLITMISPFLGDIGHSLWWYGEDRRRGGMKEGEVGGMSKEQVVRLCSDAGFKLEAHRRFVYGMNNLYVFRLDKRLD